MMNEMFKASRNEGYVEFTPTYRFSNISTAFSDTSQSFQPYVPPPDVILVTTKTYTAFFLHYHCLVTESSNRFGGLLENLPAPKSTQADTRGPRPIVYVNENEEHFNCFLLALYNHSSQLYQPDTAIFSHVFNLVIKYGFKLGDVFSPSSEGFRDLIRLAEADPLRMYTLAAHWGFEELAVSSSRHALRMDVQCITDDHALSMGPQYLLRLGQLHEARKVKLKELLLVPPTLHDKDTPTCTRRERLSVQRAYGLAAGYLTWEKAAGVTGEEIRNILIENVGSSIGCTLCAEGVGKNIHRVLELWSQMKDTI